MTHATHFEFRRCWLLLALALVTTTADGQDAKPVTQAAAQFFETKVRPILAENCFKCHGEKKHRGDLRVDSLAAMLEGGGFEVLPKNGRMPLRDFDANR